MDKSPIYIVERKKIPNNLSFKTGNDDSYSFKPSPNDKILYESKLKAFADDSFNVALTMQIFSDNFENIVGKGGKAGFQHFLLFLQ